MNTTKLKLISQAEVENGSVKGFPDVVAGDATVLKNAFVKPSSNVAEVMNGNTEALISALSNVDNTSDVDKPISKAARTELDKKATIEAPIINNATLNGTIKIENFAEIAKLAYPVGSIYQSINATSPQVLFGGTWQQLVGDAYIKIVTANAGSYGGTPSHKIGLNNMPNHDHWAYATGTPLVEDRGKNWLAYNQTHAGDSGFLQHRTDPTGGGEAYYPYYYGVYTWVRIA